MILSLPVFNVPLKPEEVARQLCQVAEEENPYWTEISPSHRYVTEVLGGGPLSKITSAIQETETQWSVTLYRHGTEPIEGPDEIPRYLEEDSVIQVRLHWFEKFSRTEVTFSLLSSQYVVEAIYLADSFLPYSQILVDWLRTNVVIEPMPEETSSNLVTVVADPPKELKESAKRQRDTTDTRATTLKRVREFHKLRKHGATIRKATAQAKTDSRTYYDNCEEATGEKPIRG